ncbi:MAG: hypothetical protein HY898_23925 [Deltaproteobacteria bacterium]|nr:hypothetical protein [Deltaproteobacteria bacterium]
MFRSPVRHLLVFVAVQAAVHLAYAWIGQRQTSPTSVDPRDPCVQARVLREDAGKFLREGRLHRASETLARADRLCLHGADIAAPVRKAVDDAYLRDASRGLDEALDLAEKGLDAQGQWDFKNAQSLFDRGIHRLEALTGEQASVESDTDLPDGGDIAWSQDRRLLAAKAGTDVLLVNVWKRRVTHRLRGNHGHLAALGFHPTGWLYAGASDGAILAWDTKQGNRVVERLVGQPIDSLAIRADGKRIAWSGERTVLAELPSFHVLAERPCSGRHLKFSPTGEFLAVVGCEDVLWSSEDGATTRRAQASDTAAIRAIAFDAESRTMAVATADVIRVEAIRSGQLLRRWRHPDPQGACLLDFQQKEMALAAFDCSGQSVRLFDASTGKQTDAVPASPPDAARPYGSNELGTIAYSPTEYSPSYYLALSTAQSVSIYLASAWHGHPELSRWMQLNTRTRPWYFRDRQQWSYHLDSDWIQHGAMSKAGDVIAMSTRDLLRVIDTRTRSIWQERGWTGEVAVSDDGALVASVSDSSRIRLWEVASRKPLRQLSGHWTQVTTLDFSPDGRFLASGSDDTRVKVFDTATGETLSTESIKPLRVIGVRFAQGARIVEIHDEEGNEWAWSWTTNLPPERATAPRGRWMESGHAPADPWLKDCTYLDDCAHFRSVSGRLHEPRKLITARWVRDDLAAVVYSSGLVAFVRAPDRVAMLEIKVLEDNPRVAIARTTNGRMEMLGEDPAAELQPACHVGAFTFPWMVCKDRFREEHLVQRTVAGDDP